MTLNAGTLGRLWALVPEEDAPVRVAPAPLRRLGPLGTLAAWTAGRALGSKPPHIFRVLGRNPSLFRAWLHWSGRLMLGGSLPRRDSELVILRVAWRTDSAYEWHQHVVLGARAGLTVAEIEGAAQESHDGWSRRQATLVDAADELLANAQLSETTWTRLRRELDERAIVELCLLIGQYQGLGTALGGLGVRVER
jgi:alkylhydroperoxidase family enzyme